MLVDKKLIVVTGTDTGIGKTYFASGITSSSLSRLGYRVAVCKPVETGFLCSENSDVEKLRQAAGAWQTIDEVVAYSFFDSVSPHIAVERNQKPIISAGF
ncbi:MAG TPA: dethiobiotin synthase [Oligoflexia bacterium]|nr:dethiobiotin synthase [Oligoflexia bacterium]HMP47193.1 dethiobiotin synthase [Oligoflexia bacterium]